MSPESERKNLINYARAEIEKYNLGEISEFSSDEELSSRFGYTPKTAYEYLAEEGILRERRLSQKEKRGYVLSRSERVHNLANYLREKLEQLQRGEIDSLPTYRELSEQFGYTSPSSSYAALKREGLIGYGRLTTSEKRSEIPSPSSTFAWIIGALSSKGSVDEESGKIILSSEDVEPLKEFQITGERLFKVNSKMEPRVIQREGKIFESQMVQFNSVNVARALGDLRGDRWPFTITEKHRWILDKKEYIWKFLEGFFDVKGGVYTYEVSAHHQVLLTVSSWAAANSLTDLLVRVGVERPRIVYPKRNKEGVSGVAITNLRDINMFANNIHPKAKEKEELLKAYRDRVKRIGQTAVHSVGDIITEWKRLTNLLGHTPKSNEIQELKKQGVTHISRYVYIKRFGGGSFIRARENLEKIIQESSGEQTRYSES